jgi:hypothetical protein
MPPAPANPLEKFADQIDTWFGRDGMGIEYREAVQRLDALGCKVTVADFMQWMIDRQRRLSMLAQELAIAEQARRGSAIADAAAKAFRVHNAPDMVTLIDMIKGTIASLSDTSVFDAEKVRCVTHLTQAVIGYSKLQIHQRDSERDERRFNRETCQMFIDWYSKEEAKKIMGSALTNDAKIERLGLAMFGEGWKE